MRLHRCFCCGAVKDLDVEEVYPYLEDDTLCDEPIPPLLCLECQGPPWKLCVLCHECWHKMHLAYDGIDMWISRGMWDGLDPLVPFVGLSAPVKVEHPWDNVTDWDADNYAPLGGWPDLTPNAVEVVP